MMTRKQFLGSLVGLVGFAAVGACTKSDDDDGGGGGGGGGGGQPDAGMQQTADAAMPGACTTTSVAIGTNHGHTLSIPAADLAAGTEKTYNIKGTSPHPHTVVITAAMFTMLKSARTITVTSSNDSAHTHSVTVTC